jgi:hypothetical protein
MPTINRNFNGTEDELAKLGCRWWKRIEATLTLSVQQHLLRLSILNQEEMGEKFNEHVIIKSEAMNGNKVLIRGWNMEDIGEGEGVSGGGNNGSTNMSYVHTWSVSHMNLIVAGVGIVHHEMVEVTGYMISGAWIRVPRVIGAGRRRSSSRSLFRDIVLFKTLPILVGCVPYL